MNDQLADLPPSLKKVYAILEEHLCFLASEYGVAQLGLFGSYVRNQETESSDLDILVDFSEMPTLFEFVRLQRYLTTLLGVDVDLVMRSGLKPRIGEHILEEVIMI